MAERGGAGRGDSNRSSDQCYVVAEPPTPTRSHPDGGPCAAGGPFFRPLKSTLQLHSTRGAARRGTWNSQTQQPINQCEDSLR